MKRNEVCGLTEDIDDFCLNSHFAISNFIAVIVVVVMLASVAFGIYGFTKSPSVETSYVSTTTTYTTTIYSTPSIQTSYINNTKTLTTTIYRVELTGTCTAVSYFLPDTTASTTPSVTTLGTTTYSTSIYGNVTTTYTSVSTSPGFDAWTVTTCILSP